MPRAARLCCRKNCEKTGDGRVSSMVLTRRSIAALLDLVEAKIDDMDIDDRESARDLRILQHCRTVLQRLGAPPCPVPHRAAPYPLPPGPVRSRPPRNLGREAEIWRSIAALHPSALQD
jgi:hypothetical protein